MTEKNLASFYNQGFGWICKNCENISQPEQPVRAGGVSRIMREGEAESKQPRFSNTALAKWTDETRTALICPRCETVETVENK